jgi:hypothetical protein
MPEPNDGYEGITVPPGFDPLKNCGAKLRKKGKLCMNECGFRTEDLGNPLKRCYLHGGLTPVKSGEFSKIVGGRVPAKNRVSLRDQIEEMRRSPDLLALDEQIAVLKAVIRRKVDIAEDSWDRYDAYLDACKIAAQTNGAMPDATMVPGLPHEEMSLLSKLVGQEYEMRFSKRFSVPLLEVQALVAQIVNAFNETATRYNISDEARRSFAVKIANLKTARVGEDAQLSRAGLGPVLEAPRSMDEQTVIDVTPSGADVAAG